jgi:hypothetical protein
MRFRHPQGAAGGRGRCLSRWRTAARSPPQRPAHRRVWPVPDAGGSPGPPRSRPGGRVPRPAAHTPGAGTPSDAGRPPAAPAHPRRWNDCENDQSDPSPGALRRDFPCLPPAAESVPLMREAARPPSVSTTSPPSAAADRGDQQATAAQRHDPPPARPGRGPAARRRLLLPMVPSIVGHLLQVGNGRRDPASTDACWPPATAPRSAASTSPPPTGCCSSRSPIRVGPRAVRSRMRQRSGHRIQARRQ